MINKKAIVIGKAVATVVSIVAVFLVMGIFVASSIGLSTLKKPEQIEATKPLNFKESELVNAITYQNYDGKTTEALIIDAIIDRTFAIQLQRELDFRERISTKEESVESEKAKISRVVSSIDQALKQHIKEKSEPDKNICFIVIQQDTDAAASAEYTPNGKDIRIRFQNGEEKTLSETEIDYRKNNGDLVTMPEFAAQKYGILCPYDLQVSSKTECVFKIEYYYGECNE